MSKAIINEQSLTDIADAIRAKNGSADTYTPSEMATAITDLPTPQTVTKGLVFSDYDSDGYPTKAEFVGEWTSLTSYFFALNGSTEIFKKLGDFEVPATVTSIGQRAFYFCKFNSITFLNTNFTYNTARILQDCKIKEIRFMGDVSNIGQYFTNGNSIAELYDFSHATSVPSLYSVDSLGHASGCVIKVPQSLLSTWQNATNWIDLQNVTWQGV